ncbi:MAG: hypothetical protein WAL91_00330, partial [Propionicimonas sp.]
MAPGAPAQGLGSAPTLATDPTACPDVTYRNQPWTLGKPGRHQSPEGTVTHERLAENAAVRTVDLGDFDVDDYRLRPAHRAILGGLVTAVAVGLRAGRIVAPVTVVVQGRTSSSGSMSHNLALSRHRAVNAAAMVRCLAKQAGIDSQLRVHWTPLGESVSQTLTGDSVEGADKRQVRILVIAPRPAGLVAPDPRPGIPGRAGGRRVIPVGRPPSPIRYPGRAPGRRITGPRSGTVTARICFEVVSVQRTGGFPWLPATGLGTAAARIRVHDDRTRSAALYELQGVVVSPRGSSDPGLAARLGPLARLAGMAQRLLGIAARAPVPAPACTPTSSVATGGSPLTLLGGLAVLVIPPAGSGRAALQLRPRSTRVRLRRRLVPVRAQRYRAPLIIVGQLLLVPVRNARAGQGEAEFAGLTEYGEWAGEDEFAPLGEAAGEWAELTEQSQNEFPALNEYGEFTELTEYGE